MEGGESGPARALPVPTSTPRKTERRGTEAAISTEAGRLTRWLCCWWSSSGAVSDHALLPPAIFFRLLLLSFSLLSPSKLLFLSLINLSISNQSLSCLLIW